MIDGQSQQKTKESATRKYSKGITECWLGVTISKSNMWSNPAPPTDTLICMGLQKVFAPGFTIQHHITSVDQEGTTAKNAYH